MITATVRNVPFPGRAEEGAGGGAGGRAGEGGSVPGARRRLDAYDSICVQEGGEAELLAQSVNSHREKNNALEERISLQQKQIAELADLVQVLQVWGGCD